MMFKKIFLLIPVIFILGLAFSQKVLLNVYMNNYKARPNSDTIYHDTSRILTWKDFKGIPEKNNPGGAITSSGFAFSTDIKVEYKVIYINVGVYTFFIKSESWKKPFIITDYHLLHEQRHFDITCLGAESFIKELVKAKFTKDNYNQVITKAFDKAFDDNTVLQQQYDRETRHSINREQQLLWNDKIAVEIKKL